jgi:hypothetical protein
MTKCYISNFWKNKNKQNANKQKERNNKNNYKKAKINEIETKKKKNIQRINETKSWFFEKINSIDKPLAHLTKMRRENPQIRKSDTKKGRQQQTPQKSRKSSETTVRI